MTYDLSHFTLAELDSIIDYLLLELAAIHRGRYAPASRGASDLDAALVVAEAVRLLAGEGDE